MERPCVAFDPQTKNLTKYCFINDKEVDKKIANTDISILAISEDEEKYLIEYGNKKRVICSRSQLSSKQDLARIISPYSYFASPIEHEEIKEYLIDKYHKSSNRLLLVDLTGVFGRYIDEHTDFWIVADFVIFKDQTFQFIPTNKIIDIETDLCVYHIDISNVSIDLLPVVDPLAELIPLNQLIDDWMNTYNCPTILYAILGYFIACMHMPEIIKNRRNFPLLGIIGTTSMGKTALLQSLYHFWGIDLKPYNYPTTSPFVELSQLCQASCFPIWRDEFRNEGYAITKQSYLRSLYDRTPISKGTSNQELKNYSPKGTLLLSGEDIITDPALRRRFVVYQLNENYKLPFGEWLQAEKAAIDNFPDIMRHVMMANWNQEIYQSIMAMDLITDNSESEEKVLYASLGAVLGREYGINAIQEANEFWKTIKSSGEVLTTRLSATEDFFEFVQNFFTIKGYYSGRTIGRNRQKSEVQRLIKIRNGEVKIYLKGLVDLAFKNGFKEYTNLGASTLVSMIKNYLQTTSSTIRIDGWTGKGIVFDESSVKLESLQSIIDNVKEAEKEDIEEIAKLENLSSRIW